MNDQLEISEIVGMAEKSLIGSILLESTKGTNEAINRVSKIIEPFDFRGCLPNERIELWIWTARVFYAMTKCSLPPHTINVALRMSELGILKLKDCALMAHCVYQTPCSLDYMDYARAVKEYSTQRKIKYYADKGDIKKLNEITKPIFEDGIKL